MSLNKCPHCGAERLPKAWVSTGLYWRFQFLPGFGGDEHFRHTFVVPLLFASLVIPYKHGKPWDEDPVCVTDTP